jgi:hypothetical protein
MKTILGELDVCAHKQDENAAAQTIPLILEIVLLKDSNLFIGYSLFLFSFKS